MWFVNWNVINCTKKHLERISIFQLVCLQLNSKPFRIWKMSENAWFLPIRSQKNGEVELSPCHFYQPIKSLSLSRGQEIKINWFSSKRSIRERLFMLGKVVAFLLKNCSCNFHISSLKKMGLFEFSLATTALNKLAEIWLMNYKVPQKLS